MLVAKMYGIRLGTKLEFRFRGVERSYSRRKSSSGHRFRFFVVSLSWLGCDALFVSSFSSFRVVVLLCWFRHVARFVVVRS